MTSWSLAEGESLQHLKAAKQVVPVRIGQLAADNTVVRWLDYTSRQECDWNLVFDCFEPDMGQCGTSGPIGFESCGLGEPEDCGPNASMRWYYGTNYCNMYCSNDMEFAMACAGMYIERIMPAWYWYVNGSDSGENMALLIETFEDFDNTCQIGDPNGQGPWLGGVVLNFGFYNGDPGGYYWTDVDLCGLDWLQLPSDDSFTDFNGQPDGSYNLWILTYVGDDPNWPDDYYLAACGQPMLWGTGTNEFAQQGCAERGKGICPYSGDDGDPDTQSSHQGPIQWDDDNPADGWHSAPDEC